MAEVPEQVRRHLRRRARERGKRFEQRVARLLGGLVYTGQDGDVEVPRLRLRVECKYRAGLELQSGAELREWLDQVEGYAKRWGATHDWALAFTGGRRYRQGKVYVVIPLDYFLRLVGGGDDRDRADA